MKEFMFRVLNQIDHQSNWSPETRQIFLKKCEEYIGMLKDGGHLIGAQPLVKEGNIIYGAKDDLRVAPLGTGEVQVGYYRIRARDMEEAIELAKGNPEFEFSTAARVEVRPIKMQESETGYIYPDESGERT